MIPGVEIESGLCDPDPGWPHPF